MRVRDVWIDGCYVFVKGLQDGYTNIACDACCLDRWMLCFCERVARWLQTHSTRAVLIGGCYVFVKGLQDGYKNIACDEMFAIWLQTHSMRCVLSGSVGALFL